MKIIESITKEELKYLLKHSEQPIYYTTLNRFAPARKKKHILTMDDNAKRLLAEYRAMY